MLGEMRVSLTYVVSKDLIFGVLCPEAFLPMLELGYGLVGPPRSEDTVLVVLLAWGRVTGRNGSSKQQDELHKLKVQPAV